MKTFGNKNSQALVSLVETSPRTFEGNPGYHVEQLCPRRRFWPSHPDAPWNALWSDDPTYWRTEYPAAWENVDDDDPGAPWNAPEPDRDPANYIGDDGEPLLWTPPTLVPLVKLPEPAHDKTTHKAEPVLVWYEDRVERDWQIFDLTAQEILDRLPPHFETSTGIKLATQEHDQTAFTRMLALIDLTQMDSAAMVIIKDAAGEKHAMSVANFKTIMAEYGAHCYTLHVGA